METDIVRACEISHINTMNTGDPQSFNMSFMYYLSLPILLRLTVFITFFIQQNYKLVPPFVMHILKKKEQRRQRGQRNLKDIKIGLLPYAEPLFLKYIIKSINAVKELERCNGTNRAVKIE